MKTRYYVIIAIAVILTGIVTLSPAHASFSNSVLIFVEGNFTKMYYNERNIESVTFDYDSSSVIFETGDDAELEIKTPIVYETGPNLFILKNEEEIAPETIADDCFYYMNLQTESSEKIEIMYAYWPEHPQTLELCETFDVPPLKQTRLGIPFDDIQCKEDMVLVAKKNGSPACVTPYSIPELVKRNWTTTQVLMNMPLSQLGEECGHYSHNEFFDRMENQTLDVPCHEFVIQKALEDEKEMHEQGYVFDTAEQVWKKEGFPDSMMSIAYKYMISLEIENSNSLRPEDRLQVGNTAGYTTVFVTLSSWDEYERWESNRGDEHDKMPPLVITQDNINPIVFDLLQEMWKFEDYEVSNHDPHLFKKKIQKDYSVPNHHGIHDWMESEYAKQFDQSNDGFSHYFEFQDNVYTITMLAVD